MILAKYHWVCTIFFHFSITILLFKRKMGKFPSPPLPPPISSSLQSQSFNLDSKISPTVLIIIVILSIIFFISGLLHLLVRLLLRPNQRDPDELLDHVTVLHGQLQQLFHLHDSGVDQSYIDTLPVFYYKAIIGLKDPFDCAVCLCEFDPNDRLRLLPKCSHAFHMDCIDTWLLSHSTCPLCRSSLLLEYGGGNNHGCSPIVCVLESGSVENSREIGGVGFDRERISVSGSNPNVGFHSEVEFGSGVGFARKSCDNVKMGCDKHEEKIVIVKLGKFRNVDVGEGTSENDSTTTNYKNDKKNNNNSNNISGGNNDVGSRRCYSMGSFAYVLDETTSLQVPIRNTPMKKQSSKKPSLPLKQGYRTAMSEYGCDSNRDFNGIEAFKTIDTLCSIENGNGNGNGNERSKRSESFSISKIWTRGGERGKKGNDYGSSRRTNSEIEIEVSELGGDEETQSCYSVDSLANPTTRSTSSTRRTLLWLMGRQNKIPHNHSNSLSSNV